MAFDQNSIPKDLRPLNIVRNVAEETHIAPFTSTGRPVEGFYVAAAPPRGGSPGTMNTVYYSPPHMSDAGVVGLGYSNGVATHGAAGWVPQVVSPGQPQLCVFSPGMVNPGKGHNHMPSFGANSNASDHTSDEGGDDSASARKVKFLCSFGGKILPRPSDGTMRYVGGQTRIISVRRDVSFDELVRNMINVYGESVVIKYQLPEEDLDALVSVSCPDDLEHMMDEYEKLSERSYDGSAKLRVFLFSASEVDSSGTVQFPDIRDSGQKYFEAVNGILEGVGVGDTTVKQSTASSEFNGADAIDSCRQGLGDFNGPPSTGGRSPMESPVHSQEATPKTDCNQGIHMDSSTGAPFLPVMSGPPPTKPTHMDHEVDRSPVIIPHNQGMEMQLPGVTFPVSPTYMQAYGDTPQETYTEYVRYPSHLRYPTPIMRAVMPVMQQQQIASGVSPRQFVPTVHARMNPSGQFPTLVQPQQFQRVDNTSGHQVVQVPVAYNPYQTQVSPQILGGGYGCHQVPNLEQVAFSEGLMQNQQGAASENVTRFEDCTLCQKALPHAHSDTIAQDQKQSPASNLSDLKSVHYSLQLDGKETIGDSGEMSVGQQMTAAQLPKVGKAQMKVTQNTDGNFIDDGYIPRKEDTYEQSIPQGVLRQAGGLQSPIGMVPQAYQDNSPLPVDGPMQHQIRQDATPTRLGSGDHPVIGAMPSPYLVNHLYESPQHYHRNISPMVSKADNQETYAGYDHQRLMERGLENLRIHPVETNNGQNKLPAESLTREDVWENLQPRRGEGESSYTIFGEHHTVPSGNQIDQIKMLPVSASESPYSHNVRPTESVREELQPVAEGVAASVCQSPAEIQENIDVQVESKDHLEEVEATKPEKINLGSPLAEGIGRLQIIKNIDLEELRELGSGTFGTVYHGKWRGTDVAIKRINNRCFAGKPSEQDRMRDDFWNEATNLADLHHPNVVAFYGVVLDGPGGSVATVTEYMVNGSLKTALQKNERNLDKRKRLLIAMDVAFGMEYLHGKNIVHFDLKSDNLLVNLRDSHRPICKVGDLGLSKVKCRTLISGGVRGTLPWMAPELLNGSSSRVSEKVDVYSFGIVLWELLTGEEPYTDLHYGAIIVSNTLRPPIPESCDPAWSSLMERCWSSEPLERPNFTEIANDLRTMASKIPAKGQMQVSS